MRRKKRWIELLLFTTIKKVNNLFYEKMFLFYSFNTLIYFYLFCTENVGSLMKSLLHKKDRNVIDKKVIIYDA